MTDQLQASARAEIEKRGWTTESDNGYCRAVMQGASQTSGPSGKEEWWHPDKIGWRKSGVFNTPWYPDWELVLGYINDSHPKAN